MNEYNATGDIGSQHLKWQNIMTYLSQAPRDDALYLDEISRSCIKRALWRPKQNKASWVKNFYAKSTKREHLVVEFLAKTCSTAVPCLLSDQHRKLVEYSYDSSVLSTAEADLFLQFFPQRLSPKADTTKYKKMRTPA